MRGIEFGRGVASRSRDRIYPISMIIGSRRSTMMSVTLELPTPTAFPAFPFNTPYEIQVELMRHLYTSIEQKKVTIIESPTGTVSI